MKARTWIIFAFCVAGNYATATWAASDAPSIRLFNGHDLTGWDTWLGSPGEGKAALGWNQDPRRVFTVVTNESFPAIRVSGEIWGALVSQAAFENYRLRAEFKWGEKRWPPREREQSDSGIFYHSQGQQPPNDSCWLAGSQCSLAEVDSGDFWPIEVTADAEVRRLDQTPSTRSELEAWYRRNGVSGMPWQWSPGGERRNFSGGLKSGFQADHPRGQWNVAEVICRGDTAVHIINGVTNLILLNLKQNEAGTFKPLRRGRLQLQSEGAEIFFRRVELTPLSVGNSAAPK